MLYRATTTAAAAAAAALLLSPLPGVEALVRPDGVVCFLSLNTHPYPCMANLDLLGKTTCSRLELVERIRLPHRRGENPDCGKPDCQPWSEGPGV